MEYRERQDLKQEKVKASRKIPSSAGYRFYRDHTVQDTSSLQRSHCSGHGLCSVITTVRALHLYRDDNLLKKREHEQGSDP